MRIKTSFKYQFGSHSHILIKHYNNQDISTLLTQYEIVHLQIYLQIFENSLFEMTVIQMFGQQEASYWFRNVLWRKRSQVSSFFYISIELL